MFLGLNLFGALTTQMGKYHMLQLIKAPFGGETY